MATDVLDNGCGPAHFGPPPEAALNKIKQILFPVDFSERCEGAARYVEAFAREFDAEVTFLHALDAADYVAAGEFGAFDTNELFRARLERATKQMREWQSDLFRSRPTRREVVEGETARSIVEWARKSRTDLIMMPSHGMGPFRRFVLGSVTAKVLHDAQCPVWTGAHLEKAPPVPVISFQQVVCALDLSERSVDVLLWASSFAAATGAALTIAHAIPAMETRPEKYLDQEFVAALRKDAQKEIAKLQARVGTDARVFLRGGDPSRVVHDVATEVNADYVVVGRGHLGDGRLRTHAYAIIRHAPCPVISV